jgi:xanthine dehydrogenase YagT iron-sulfur-binding subunit
MIRPAKEGRSMSESDVSRPGAVSRRGFLKVSGAVAAATSFVGPEAVARAPRQDAPPVLRGETDVAFKLNGAATTVKVGTGVTLLDLLRDKLDLTGSKQVCDRGSCGACTVHLDGKPVNSCLLLAVDCAGREVVTVEGLANGDRLNPVQQAFCEEDALQCGFCTSGMVMTCTALLAEKPAPTLDETKSALAGNICRCGTYANIFRAVDRAAALVKGGK